MNVTASQAIPAEQTMSARYLDPWLLGLSLVLLGFGLVMVYSATMVHGAESLYTSYRSVTAHAINIALGLVLIVAVLCSRLTWWERASKFLLILGMLSLAAVLIPGIGVEVNGSTRWLEVGPLRVQPSEFVKVLVVLYVAGYVTRKRDALQCFSNGVVIIGVVVSILAVLLLSEPDFGGFVVITATVVVMLFLAGIRFLHFTLWLAGAVAACVALTVISPYRVDRVMGFLNPWSDPYGNGFQLVQALIAFGRGEGFGVGLGVSIQKLSYLPHASNDFILAVIAEELGFVGVLAVMALFGALLWRTFQISRRAERSGQLFAARLAQGLGLLLVLQAMVNMGVNMGVLPTKGLTLPLMSYGGSSLLASCLAIGLLLIVERESRPRAGSSR